MRRRTIGFGAAAFTGAVCLAAFGWAGRRELAAERDDAARETLAAARQAAGRFWGGLERHRIALEQMANYCANSEQVTEEEFHSFAAETLALAPLYLRISLVDPSLHVRWAHPFEAQRLLAGFDVADHPQGNATLERALRERRAILSPPLQLVDGPQGFALAVPIFQGERHLGQVAGALRSSDLFSSVIAPETLERYDILVSDSGTPLFASGRFDGQHLAPLVTEAVSPVGGRTWEVRMKPKDEVFQARLRDRAGFWAVGSLLALALGALAGLGVCWGSSLAGRVRSQRAELRETRQRLDGAMNQLVQAEKLTALGELVAGVAHEMNNPLAAIMGYAQLLQAGSLPPEQVKRRLETIRSEADRMAGIVRNLLTFARKHPPQKQYLDLNEIVEKTLALKGYHLRTSRIRVEKDLAPDLPRTMLDPHQMQQVFLNLLTNAEHALTASGRGGVVRLTTRRLAGRIEARVSDDGPGVPEDLQGRIFEPFFTTKAEGQGTGLGLSICYGILREHGGELRVLSGPGAGATFAFDLPVAGEPGRAPEAGPLPVDRPAAPLRVLVVDDEPSVRDFLVELLTLRGHAVETAPDVPEALAKIAADGHDVIISDMKMPGGTGKDIYRAVAASTPRLARRIVFTTGDGASEETRSFLRETGNEILLKPCGVDQIERAVARASRN